MIENYFRPESISQAIALKSEHGAKAVYFGGGTKLNATPTKTDKTVAIALFGLGEQGVQKDGAGVRIGAMTKLQLLRENPLTPVALQQAIGFIYSRNIRNQATLAGEIAAVKDECPIIPALLALRAELVMGDGKQLLLEDYLASDRNGLIVSVIIPDTGIACAINIVRRSAAGLIVLTAAVSVSSTGERIIAIDGLNQPPMRLKEIEKSGAVGEALEKAVAAAVKPVADLCGSVEYKRYIAGVLVADLLATCK